MNRDIIYSNSFVEIKVYHYNDDTSLSVDTFFVDDLLQVMTEKSLSNPSGTFSFKIAPSKNWKKIIKPGDWLTISFSNNGEKRIKLLGNVDRVSRTKEIDDTGALSTRYMVYGRDFGKVFEKTNIYFNPYLSRETYVNSVLLKEDIIFSGSPDDIIKTLLNVFIGPGTEKIDELQQWYIPDRLKQDLLSGKNEESLKSDGASFFDLLDQNKIQDTIGYKYYRSVSSLQGYLWNILKQNSHQPINELFTELQYDKDTGTVRPNLILRPLPFTQPDFENNFSTTTGDGIPTTELPSNLGDLTFFKDIERIKITDKEMIFEDLGESDHVRFNFTLMTSSSEDFFNKNSFADWSSGDVPVVNDNSIRKHGLLMRSDSSDFANFSDGLKEKFDPNLLRNLNLLLNHWYEHAHELESGTVKMVGNLDVEIGKTLEISYTQNNDKFLYYIEGYTNEWQYPGLWTTTAKLTRGYKLTGNRLDVPEEDNSEDKIYTGMTKINKRRK